MRAITNNEMGFILRVFKNPEVDYNANNIAVELGMSRMGSLKIARKLEKENILVSKQFGKAKFYKLNLGSEYVQDYISFLLKRESQLARPYVKRWVNELKKIKSADVAILFGSVLREEKDAGDVDVLFVVDSKKFSNLKREVTDINIVNIKKIHPLYQSAIDFKNNIRNKDKPLLSAIKGLVIFGEDKLMGFLKNESCKK